MASQAEHVEIMTSLALKNFFMAYGRSNDIRGNEKVIYLDHTLTSQAASKILTDLLKSPELKNSIRITGIRRKFIP